MEMTIPNVCLGSCSANVCPHTFWQKGCFSNWIENIKLVVLAVYIAPFLSQSNKTLQYFKITASLVNRTLFPWSLWKLSSRVDFMSAFLHQQKLTKLSFNQPRSVPRGSNKCLRNFHLKVVLQMKTQRTIDNNKSAFVSVILLLPEFHCSPKLISIVSRPRPLPSLPRRRS